MTIQQPTIIPGMPGIPADMLIFHQRMAERVALQGLDTSDNMPQTLGYGADFLAESEHTGTIPIYSAVSIIGSEFDNDPATTGHVPTYKYSPVLTITRPVNDAESYMIGITQEPIKASGTGVIRVSGVSLCQIASPVSDMLYADLKSASFNLRPCPGGRVRLLHEVYNDDNPTIYWVTWPIGEPQTAQATAAPSGGTVTVKATTVSGGTATTLGDNLTVKVIT